MTTLTIENPEISFNVSPNSNSLRTVVIPVERIAKKPTRNGPKSYLIIGVDTEYQALAPVAIELIHDREIDAQNEILSYQMYVQEISETASSQVVVSEIIIPPPGKRIAIQHFIGFALGLWAESNPGRAIPYDLYLVGHFTRADLPSFADFRKNAQAMTNVRNTFVNAEQSFLYQGR